MLEIAQAEAAILFRNRDAVQAELAHLRPELAGKPVLLVDLGSERRDPVRREAARRLAYRVGHFAEREIESEFGHASLPVGAALAEGRGFEQGGVRAYVRGRFQPLLSESDHAA